MKKQQRRPGKEVVEARVREIANILLDGAVPGLDVVDFIREREAEEESPFFVGEDRRPLSYSQCRRIIKRAERLISETVKQDRQKLLDLHLAKRRNLYAKAVATADYRCALSILADEAELLGLYPARRTEHTGTNGEALYPSLSAMVVAIVQHEAQATTLVNVPQEISADEPGATAGAAAAVGRGEEVPRQPRLLRDDLLQDPRVE